MIQVNLNNLADLRKYFKDLPKVTAKAAALAVNAAVRFGAAEASRQIRETINIKRDKIGNVTSATSALRISKFAKPTDPEAVITARQRPFSLANFATGPVRFGPKAKGPITVSVKRGTRVRMRDSAFFITLKNGNLGLAVRVPKGETLDNKRILAKPIGGERKDGSKVYVLYGPSVDQLFREVRNDISPEVSNRLVNEFLRQVERLR